MINNYKGKIREIKVLNEVVKSFTIDFEGELNFKAGQFINLGFNDGDNHYVRPYSIASSPYFNKSLQLIIRLVKSGKVTPHLWNLKEGSNVDFKGAFGTFNFDNKLKKDNLIFIASGTGVAPFRSMIQDILYNKKLKKQLILMLGVKYERDIILKKEFEDLEKEFSNFKFVPIVSREDKFNGRKGHVQNNFDLIDPLNSEIYLCGLPAMVNGSKVELLKLGVPEEFIYLEKY